MATKNPTSVAFPDDLREKLLAEAAEKGVPVSSIIRWAVAARYGNTSIEPVPTNQPTPKNGKAQK